MTDELRDYTTPPGWTRADTDRLLDAALARNDPGSLAHAAATGLLEPAPEAPETDTLTQGYRPHITTTEETNAELEAWLTRRRYKYAPAFTPHVRPANVSPYWHGPQPATMICYSDHVIDTLMERPDRYAWLANYLDRHGASHPKPSPRAYALAHGLRGAAADMFAEIAGIIQNAKADVPW